MIWCDFMFGNSNCVSKVGPADLMSLKKKKKAVNSRKNL